MEQQYPSKTVENNESENKVDELYKQYKKKRKEEIKKQNQESAEKQKKEMVEHLSVIKNKLFSKNKKTS